MSQSAEDTKRAEAPRYDFDAIDLESGSTHADVVLLVGEDRRVLELGPATGYMSRAFKDRGCTVVGIELDPEMAQRAAGHLDRVIVGDLERLAIEEELAGEQFDAIVAADVLEHLTDPLGVLRRLLRFLAPDGSVVLSIPNVAHGSVRLSLLEGAFEYQDIGLLDRTHRTFFTRHSLGEMLDAAELGIAVLHRHELELSASEVPFDPDAVPAELRDRLDHDPDARTYQFVVRAVPMGRDGLREVQRELREQATAVADAEQAARRRDLERRNLEDRLAAAEQRADESASALALVAGREGELRRSLVEAHDQLLAREAELGQLRTDFEIAQDDLAREQELRRGDQAWSAELTAALESTQQQLREARARSGGRVLVRAVLGRLRRLLARG